MVSTDIPRGEVDRFVELALKARSQKIATLSLVPPMINTADPDIALVQQKVADGDRAGRGQARARRARHGRGRARGDPPRRRRATTTGSAADVDGTPTAASPTTPTPAAPPSVTGGLDRLALPGLCRQPVGGPRRRLLIERSTGP